MFITKDALFQSWNGNSQMKGTRRLHNEQIRRLFCLFPYIFDVVVNSFSIHCSLSIYRTALKAIRKPLFQASFDRLLSCPKVIFSKFEPGTPLYFVKNRKRANKSTCKQHVFTSRSCSKWQVKLFVFPSHGGDLKFVTVNLDDFEILK